MQPRLGDRIADGASELQHDGLLALVDGEGPGERDDHADQHDERDGDANRDLADLGIHLLSPFGIARLRSRSGNGPPVFESIT